MYKDPDKQREANREASKKYRDSMTGKGMTVSPEIIPESDIRVIPERTAQGNVKVSKPGDANYVPQCETTKAFIEDRPRRKRLCFGIRTELGKRGKDIKCFEDLPADVQQTIDKMSVVDGKIDQTIKVNRTAIAVHYQHLFPDRFHSTGIAM